MFWFYFNVLFLVFALYSFSAKSDYLEIDKKDFAANSSNVRMAFHKMHGREIVISHRATVATRTRGYCLGMTFTEEPVSVNERIYVKILKTTSTWPGWLQIGFTANSPSDMESAVSQCLMPFHIKRTWSKEVDAIYASEKSVFFFYVDKGGRVHYGKEGEDEILFVGVDTSYFLFAVLFLYGNTLSVQLLGNSGDVLSKYGVETSRERGISYLMSLRNSDWGWDEDTHRAIVALYLSGATTFNGTDLEEQLMVKQLESETSLALSRNVNFPLSANELALYINALLVTCYNPRNFHGFDLIALLKKEILREGNATNPFVYIALCNANETMPPDTVSFLKSMLEHDSEYLFWTDFQAMAVMALACNARLNGNKLNADPHITRAVDNFMKLQYPDGSFGSIYTSALVVQALLASGHIIDQESNVYDTVRYFLLKQNASDDQSFGDFLSTYSILPILNEKSLVDVGQVICSNRKASKMMVKYSLCFGENMETRHATSLNVSSDITILDVMNLAAKENRKFKYLYKMVSRKMYVYSIGKVANDAEKGMFWQLYLSTKENEKAILKTEGPGKISLRGGERIIMWYKTVDVPHNYM